MKWLTLLFVAIAVCSASVIKDPNEGYKEGDRYFYFPGDGDGILHLVDTHEPVDEDFIRDYVRNSDNNGYWLFTRANPTTADILLLGDVNSVISSNLMFDKNIVFLAHGWNGRGGNTMNILLTRAFLEDNDVNVIVLDWSRLANRNYVTAKNGVPAVGRGLGQFISWLVSLGASYDKMHLVGFSLGGHLVGSAGRETGSLVRRITALDPAGPLWGRDRDRIVETDGQYVEVMHTNTAMYGFSDPCGDADFYPNGGSSMPGCILNSCSHSLAYDYMASSIRHNHLLANECDSLRDATRNRCNGELNPMGNSDLLKTRSGIFRVNTERRYPF
ncbi:lipase member H-like [Hyposmocoma kahamanoa]|uniref:lipase member H-like n=1 Tax=Hyposmocoma kahamanoa TaxID=1477025 RepID=UPI000E6DA313|nr:lipase member H-like [Hyposmocoma kahamanoa]